MSEREEQSARDAFLDMVGHELRQPLAPILTALEVMRQRRSRESGERARRTIERQVWQLARLVEDLLDYANAERGVLTLRIEPVDLRHVVDAAIETAQPVLRHREQQVQFDLLEGAVRLLGDPARLTQVFANLLSNTARFVEPGSTIAIDVIQEATQVSVQVRDTSRGISSDKLNEIFSLLVNVEPETGWPGVGIGLAVVRTVVELHGGRVTAEGPKPDRGAQFIVVLPLHAAQAGATPPVARQARSESSPPLS